jgi:hypothetical protein
LCHTVPIINVNFDSEFVQPLMDETREYVRSTKNRKSTEVLQLVSAHWKSENIQIHTNWDLSLWQNIKRRTNIFLLNLYWKINCEYIMEHGIYGSFIIVIPEPIRYLKRFPSIIDSKLVYVLRWRNLVNRSF